MASDSSISLVINTKNEEHNIKDCINSAKDIADEIIVVDMESKDKTVEIAKKLGAKTFTFKDHGYVEPARNFALGKATKHWTLVLDADERLTKTVKAKIKELTKKGEYDGFKFPFKNILLGKWIEHSMWWPDYHIRVFRTGHLDWPTGVHQDQNFTGSIFEVEAKEENAFVHYNIADVKELLSMVDEYSSVEAIFKSIKNPTAYDLIEYLDKEFKWRFLEHKGYLDGMHGLILAKFMNVYRLLEVAKYWEREGYKKMFDPIELKNAVEAGYTLPDIPGDEVNQIKKLTKKLIFKKMERARLKLNKLKSFLLPK